MYHLKSAVRLLIFMLLLLAAALSSAAAEWTVTDAGIDLPAGSIHYPKLLGGDGTVSDEIGRRIAERGEIGPLLDRLAVGQAIEVSWSVSESALAGDILSCAFAESGRLSDLRSTFRWRTLTVDLRTGSELMLTDLFTDPQAGLSALESIVSDEIAPLLNPMMGAELLPLPELFQVDASGLTLYWPADRYQTLNGQAGSARIRWSELNDCLRTDEESIFRRCGGRTSVSPDRNAVETAVAEGSLPGIPAALGGSVSDLLERAGLAEDPDLCSMGRMFALENGAFRETWLISDALTDSWDSSLVQMIRSDCLDLYGLMTGKTEQREWRSWLGSPDNSLTVDAEHAEAARILPGQSDYYRFGDHLLRLHADEEGILRSIFLLE